MFASRRHRPPNQPLTAATANPNAASAAASAFSRQPSSHSLSSAAAAAALRARPHTPTNVAQVQTKRTMRRSASVSSAGSRDGAGGLGRSLSAGSMSERSLRLSSPHRAAVHNSGEDPPPVPSIPDHAVPTSNGDARYGHKRRTVSLHVPPLKLGSDMMKEGHTSWFGPPTTDPAARMRTSDAPLHTSEARPRSSGSSINFSYPRGPRVSSPTTESPSTDKPAPRHAPTRPSTAGSAQELVYDPNSRRMVRRSEILSLEQDRKEPPRKSTGRKKKKRASAPSSDSGTGAVSKPEEPIAEPGKRVEALTAFEAPELVTGRMYEDMGAEMFMEPRTESNEEERLGSRPEFSVPALPDTYHPSAGATLFPSRGVSSQPRYQAYRPPTASVHEIAEGAGNYRHVSSAQGNLPVRASTHNDNRLPAELPADHIQETSQEEPPAQSSAESGKAIAQDPRGASTGHHKTVSIAGKGMLAVPVRHSPPPRSTSPIKSALKHHVGSDHGSEASTDITHQHMNPAVARKKSVRVSFDDESTVVGEATPDNNTSAGAPAATKKRWFNLSRRRDGGTSTGDTEDDEVMKPRPMLPSFGSIREKKTKSNEERPLVRPLTFANSPTFSASSAVLPTIPSDPDLGGHGEGVSSDHAIGTALTDDLAHRHEENASDLREPLPPQVTSVEGDGLWSDESSGDSLLSSDEEEQLERLAISGANQADATPASTAPGSDVTRAEEGAISTGEEGHGDSTDRGSKPNSSIESTSQPVPQISVSGASDPSLLPREEADVPDSPRSSESEQFFDVPGTFPDNDGAESDPGKSQISEIQPEETTSQTPQSTPSRDLPATIEEETEESGIFSDAYEDLSGSDVDEDGFQSLGAIADRPVGSEISQKASGKAVASMTEEIGETKTTTTSAPAQADGALDMDWEQAKAYWRNLSSEKRRQLEREAIQDAGEEADLDESRPTAKPKKKKSGKMRQSNLGEGQALPTDLPVQGAYGRQAGRFLHKTLRGPRPMSSDGASVAGSQRGGQGMLKSLRSPPPAAPSEVSSEGGMRKSLRTQRSPDAAATQGTYSKEKRHSLQLPTSSLSLAQKLKARPNRRTVSLEENTRDSGRLAWTAVPQRRGSFSSESSFKRVTPRPESTGFRKTLRSDSDSPGMVPGSNSGKMGSFSLRSSSPPRGAFRRRSLGSSPSASAGGRVRTSLRSESSEESPRHRRIFSFGRFSRKGKQAARDLDDSSDEDVFAEPLSSQTGRQPVAANGSILSKAITSAPADEPPQEESAELSDSDSDHAPAPATVPSKQTALGTSLLANGSLPPSRSGRGSHAKPERKGKGGLMSALRRRKADHGGIARPERMESAARRDTRLERSAAELDALREDDSDDGGESIEVPRRRLEKRGPGEGLEGKRRFSALRRVFKMSG